MARLSMTLKLGFLLSLSGLGACTAALNSRTANVNVRFVSGEINGTSTSRLSTSHSALTDQNGAPIALKQDYCYGIMVSAYDKPELNRFADNSDDGKSGNDPKSLLCKQYSPKIIGQMNGFYKYGADATLKVPVGKDRMFLMMMVPKGKNGAPADCSGALDVLPYNKDGKVEPRLAVNGVIQKELQPIFVAYGQSTITAGTNVVDMRLLNGADGLDCNGDGDQLQTIPFIQTDSQGGGQLNYSSQISTDGTQFLKVFCPDGASKVQLKGYVPAALNTRDCSGDTNFIGLQPGANYTLNILDGSGTAIDILSRTFTVQTGGKDSFTSLRNPDNREYQQESGVRLIAANQDALIFSGTEPDPSYKAFVTFGLLSSTNPSVISGSSTTTLSTGISSVGIFNSGGNYLLPFFSSGFMSTFNLATRTLATAQNIGASSVKAVISINGAYAVTTGTGSVQEIIISASSDFSSVETVNSFSTGVVPGGYSQEYYAKVGLRNATSGNPMLIMPYSSASIATFECVGNIGLGNACASGGVPSHSTFFALDPVAFCGSASCINPSSHSFAYTRKNSNGSQNRAALLYQDTNDNTWKSTSISLDGNVPGGSRSVAPTDSDVESGTFYPALIETGGKSFNWSDELSFNSETDFPPESNDGKTADFWNEQLFVAVTQSNPTAYYIYRSPDGGRNWFRVYTADATHSPKGAILSISKWINSSTGQSGLSPSFIYSEYDSTASKQRYLMQNSDGF